VGHLFVSLSGNYLPLGLLLEGEGGNDVRLQILKSVVAEVYRTPPEAYESVRVFKQGLLRHHSVPYDVISGLVDVNDANEKLVQIRLWS